MKTIHDIWSHTSFQISNPEIEKEYKENNLRRYIINFDFSKLEIDILLKLFKVLRDSKENRND